MLPDDFRSLEGDDQRKARDSAYRELQSKTNDVQRDIVSITASLNVFKWIAGAMMSAITVVGWNTCSRAQDNEKQITVNTNRLAYIESHLQTVDGEYSTLDKGGSQEARLAAQQIIEMNGRLNSLTAQYIEFEKNQQVRHSALEKALYELQGAMAEHEKNDERMRQNIDRIDRLQQERINKERSDPPPHF